MKNIKLIAALLLTVLIVTVGCEPDKVNYDTVNGKLAYMFNTATSSLPVNGPTTTPFKIVVGVTTKADVDRALPIRVDASSTALAAEYSLNASTLKIPAGSFVGEVEITPNFAAIPNNVTRTIVLILDETTGIDVIDTRGRHVVSMFRFCPTALVGNYSVTTTYQSHDFLPNYASNTMTAAVTAATGANTYRVLDFSGGLYSTGPYNTAYGTGSAANAANRDLTFTVNCGQITWTNERDPYGPIIPTPGAVNALNATPAGSFTISWTATAYGERGISVYTRLP